ncbi:hypothetical protein GQ42DRAFT_154046 [Ramicandelaber brevisporus]|nr:hypothetical protein GQ42DRAFT_154046 [Ramicandelaber brevisporus]
MQSNYMPLNSALFNISAVQASRTSSNKSDTSSAITTVAAANSSQTVPRHTPMFITTSTLPTLPEYSVVDSFSSTAAISPPAESASHPGDSGREPTPSLSALAAFSQSSSLGRSSVGSSSGIVGGGGVVGGVVVSGGGATGLSTPGAPMTMITPQSCTPVSGTDVESTAVAEAAAETEVSVYACAGDHVSIVTGVNFEPTISQLQQ